MEVIGVCLASYKNDENCVDLDELYTVCYHNLGILSVCAPYCK